MNIRNRRLQNDYEKVLSDFAGNEHISVHVIEGDPPSHYQVMYHVNGIKWDEAICSAIPITEHVVDIFLRLGYPKMQPKCTMLTPIWHPNIGDYVCIGDFWSAGVTLADIIVHIGNMIQYKSYNLGSPVNKTAAVWAQANAKLFPLDDYAVIVENTSELTKSDEPEIVQQKNDVEISLGTVRSRI